MALSNLLPNTGRESDASLWSAPPRLPFRGLVLDSLVQNAAKNKTPAEYFESIVDRECISPTMWQSDPHFGDLSTLVQVAPTFTLFDHLNIKTHACLVVDQPGPVFVPNANTPMEPFRVRLVPHPLLPEGALQTWRVGSLKVTLLRDIADGEQKAGSKKRGRPQSLSKRQVKGFARATLSLEYNFSSMDICIDDLQFPASGCKPVKLEFCCSVVDPLNRNATFIVTSQPFIIVSNCNQWREGFGTCLADRVFGPNDDQAPFCRFFNHLQLAYLYSKGLAEDRYLESDEILNWLKDSVPENYRMERDRELLESHQTVTRDLFESWFNVAGPVFYDLHTTNVGKLFQRLWAAGFVGIGTTQYFTTDTNGTSPGHYRLNIHTTQSDMRTRESYLILQSSKGVYPLLALERDHLEYFFEHSRHSQDCTHLVSTTSPNLLLPVECLFAAKDKVVDYATLSTKAIPSSTTL